MSDINALAEQVLPAGTTDPEAVAAAASLVAELVRRLNHATLEPSAIPGPKHADRIVAAVGNTVLRLPQLLRQLADRMGAVARFPGLSVDSLGPVPAGGAASVARDTRDDLTAAASHAEDLSAVLRAAGRRTSRLYLADPPPRPIL